MSLFHRKIKNSPYGLSTVRLLFRIFLPPMLWRPGYDDLIVYGLWSLTFLVDSETIWSALRYTLFILLRFLR